jgi:signal transduction histidine kinase
VRKDKQYVVLFEDMRSAVAVPLQYSREDPSRPEAFLGVLLLESSRLSDFNQQDVELLEALAQEAVIAIQNATRHRQLRAEQEKRLAAEKWAVMGQAATALAHRINNLMGIVPVSAREIQRTLTAVSVNRKDQDWIEANLGRIERNAQFILKLSDALFKPFKDSGPESRLDVNHLLNEALESADLPEHISVSKVLAPDLPPVRSNLLLLDVFLELIVNARKAMEDMPEPQLSLNTGVQESHGKLWVIAEIRDTGRGISEEQSENLWKMFQHSEDGLGFGLWWLRTFIEHRGGTIDCASRRNQGATFTVRLPADRDQSGADAQPKAP